MQKIAWQRNWCVGAALQVRPLLGAATNFTGRSVQSIAHDRMSQGSHVHSNLVGASGGDFNSQERELPRLRLNPPLHFITRHGLSTAAAPGSHADAANRIALNGSVDRAAVVFQPAMYERDVGFPDSPTGKLSRQRSMSHVIFRHHNQTAGVLVQAMHDP